MEGFSTKSNFVCWYFFFIGFAVGNWISRLADIRDSNGLSYSLMGSVLVCGAVGALTSLPIVAIVGKKYGSAACLLFGSLWLCIVIPLLGVGGIGLPILYPSMFGVGIGLGFTDVGMTSQGILVEKDFHINRMGFFQASMSIGSFIGVLIGGIFSTFGVSPFFEFLCVSLMSFPISILCYFHLYGVNDEAVISELYGNVETPSCTKKVESHHPTNLQLITHLEAGPLPSSQMNAETTFISGDPMDSVMVSEADSVAVVPEDDHHYMAYLCIIGFCAQIGEGTISDWSTMYFADDLNASPIVTITGYAAFSLMMALGRVMGDKLGMEYGRMVLLKFSGTLSTMGLGIAVLAPSLESAGPVYWAVFGFTLAGAGLSLCMPIVSSSAGDISGVEPTDGVATVTSMAYLGFLLGPPFFGAMGDVLGSIRWSLLICCGVLCFMVLCPGRLPLNKRHTVKENENSVVARMAGKSSINIASSDTNIDDHV